MSYLEMKKKNVQNLVLVNRKLNRHHRREEKKFGRMGKIEVRGQKVK